MSISVLLCSRIRLFAEGIGSLLGPEEGIEAIGVACCEESLRSLRRAAPDVILADREMGRLILANDGDWPDSRLLLLHDGPTLPSGFDDLRTLVARGLSGILAGDTPSRLLGRAIRRVAAGELWFDHQTVAESLYAPPPSPQPTISLTRKETEVLHLLCEGNTNKQIAARLFISEQTVKSHCNRLFKKFGVSNRLSLVLAASHQAPDAFDQNPSL